MPEDWNKFEVESIVSDYFKMWEFDLRGIAYNKAEHNRRLREIVTNRNRSAVEDKHRNISAVLWHLGYPYLRGYKPLPNYQRLLRTEIEQRLLSTATVNQLISDAVAKPIKRQVSPPKSNAIKVVPPRKKEFTELVADAKKHRTAFAPRNYLEIEAQNRSLGEAGEEFIMSYEHKRLWAAGKRNLADRIERVSVTKGDYLGFDILSFETSGRERLIEVKTTRYGQMSRFFVSANELSVSEKRSQQYHLHRLFNFDKKPQFFVLSGSLKRSCSLKPSTYSAVPASA